MSDHFQRSIKTLLTMLNMEPSTELNEEVVTLSVDDKLYIYMSELPSGHLLMFCPVAINPQLDSDRALSILSANFFMSNKLQPMLGFDKANNSLTCWIKVDLSHADDSMVFQAFESLLIMSEEWAEEMDKPISAVNKDKEGAIRNNGLAVRF